MNIYFKIFMYIFVEFFYINTYFCHFKEVTWKIIEFTLRD